VIVATPTSVPTRRSARRLLEPLSAREIELLRLLAESKFNQAIADMLIVGLSRSRRIYIVPTRSSDPPAGSATSLGRPRLAAIRPAGRWPDEAPPGDALILSNESL
jgi:hypothetical protein